MKYKLARHARNGMHIVRTTNPKRTSKGLCGKSVGGSYYYPLSAGTEIRKDPESDDHNGWCPACFGFYANEFLVRGRE